MKLDYGIERRLAQLAPSLHGRYRDCVVTSQQMLSRYENYFPDFTDHTVLHTLDILELCNQLIGSQIMRLTAEDLYILLMGALFHDVGMGVSTADFAQFRAMLGFPEPEDDTARAWAVRDHHHELSGCTWKSIGVSWIFPTGNMPRRLSRSAGGIGKPIFWIRRRIRRNSRWSRAGR